MNLIKLFVEAAILRAAKWALKVVLNILKPYVAPALSHPRLFPVHVLYFLGFYSIRTWINEKDWTAKLGISRLTAEAKEQMNKILILILVAVVLDTKKGQQIIPRKVYSVSDLANV